MKKNIFNKIKECLFRDNSIKKDRDYPSVTYMNRSVRSDVEEWLRYIGVSKFGKLLLDIGFNKNDIVYLYGIDSNEIHYSVNTEKLRKENVIRLKYGSFLEGCPRIIINDGKVEKTYDLSDYYICEPNGNIFLESVSYELGNGMDCKRYYYVNQVLYRITNKNYKFEFSVEIDYDNNIDRINDNVLRLNNEDELEKYFNSLEFPISIVDVYKKICEITSLDIDQYKKIRLEIREINIFGKESDIVETICLEDGMLVKFGTTKNNKRIFVYDDGSYSYRLVGDNEEEFCFSLDTTKDNVSYSVSSGEKNKIDDDFKMIVNDTIDNAVCEIEDSKKRIRKMFDKRWNN